ncbi:MAG: hypothetical protein ACE5FW_02120 [Candidatus Aenigmatarchaeota archaeon]
MPEKAAPKAKLTIREILSELVERTNSNMRRLRILEQKSDTLTNRLSTLESSILEVKGSIKEKAGGLEKRITEEDERVIRVENAIKDIINQLKRTATTSHIKELEQLMDIYSPLKSKFVTREEVERLIEESKK